MTDKPITVPKLTDLIRRAQTAAADEMVHRAVEKMLGQAKPDGRPARFIPILTVLLCCLFLTGCGCWRDGIQSTDSAWARQDAAKAIKNMP